MSKPIPSEEQKKFAQELKTKVYERFQGRTLYISEVAQSVMDMVQHKMAKENWNKSIESE